MIHLAILAVIALVALIYAVQIRAWELNVTVELPASQAAPPEPVTTKE